MIFTILISVVFIAELIIMFTILSGLIKFNKKVNEINETIKEIKPGIGDICRLARDISGQIVELIRDFVDRVKAKQEEVILYNLAKFLLSSFLVKKLKRNKLLSKGLSLLQIVV